MGFVLALVGSMFVLDGADALLGPYEMAFDGFGAQGTVLGGLGK